MFFTGTSDFEKIERTSATNFSGDPIFPTALRTFKLLSFGGGGGGGGGTSVVPE